MSILLIILGLFPYSFFTDDITAIKLAYHFDIYDEQTKKVYPIEGSNQIFFYKKIELYKQENIFIDEHNKEHTDFDYYVYDRQKKEGRKFNRRYQELGIKFNVDTFLLEHTFKNTKFYNSQNHILVSGGRKLKQTKFKETYLQSFKKDYSYSDSLFFSFDDELKNIPISISKELDSLRQSKTVKMLAIFKPTYDGENKLIPERKVIVEISKVKDFNKSEIQDYFNKFINMEK